MKSVEYTLREILVLIITLTIVQCSSPMPTWLSTGEEKNIVVEKVEGMIGID